MKILLIEPKYEHGVVTYLDKKSPFSKIYTNPSITLPMVAALTSGNHQIKIVNENYEDLQIDEEFDLVGISVLTMTAPRAYELADLFRRRGTKVVLGGYHVSALPDEAIQHADAIIIGEAEDTWPQLIKDAEKGRLKRIYRSRRPSLTNLPWPRRDLYYNFIAGAVQATRGCPVGCKFCPTSWLLGRRLRKRPIDEVIEEIKSIPNRVIIFRDASLTIDVDYSKSLFRAMKGLGKKWIANGNINVLGRDEEFLRLAKEAGCIQWFIGLESLSKETLKRIHKTTNVNVIEKYGEYIEKIHKYGMAVFAGLIFGFDEDTPDVFETTYKALEEWRVDAAEFNILTPYPGTKIYDDFEKEGRILTKDWSKYTQAHVVFKPKNMSPDDLMEGYTWITKKFYSFHNSLKRCLYHLGYSLKWELSPVSTLSVAATNFGFRRYYARERKRIQLERKKRVAT
ncbi:MAG TPA: B12-binding domain-containing radical SAM protein [Thermoplasmatales archaeon]|nr:B12-binding domain-containing radical SAM protein [Thermoplasmatales archaeon]